MCRDQLSCDIAPMHTIGDKKTAIRDREKESGEKREREREEKQIICHVIPLPSSIDGNIFESIKFFGARTKENFSIYKEKGSTRRRDYSQHDQCWMRPAERFFLFFFFFL